MSFTDKAIHDAEKGVYDPPTAYQPDPVETILSGGLNIIAADVFGRSTEEIKDNVSEYNTAFGLASASIQNRDR